MKQRRRLRVFLCHASNDKNAVRKICRQLRDDGFDPWLDEEQLTGGQSLKQALEQAISDSDVALVFLTRHSVSHTGVVNKEIQDIIEATEKRPKGVVFAIPVRLEECEVPQDLRTLVWVDIFDNRPGYEKLRQGLKDKARSLGLIEVAPQGFPTEDVYAKASFVHHVSLPVRDLDRSVQFYEDILRLKRVERPDFGFPGAWFEVGTRHQHLHLVYNPKGSFRRTGRIEPRDSHFAVHVTDFFSTIAFLRDVQHYRQQSYPANDGQEGLGWILLEPFFNTRGFLQSYIVDPDNHVIEITAHVTTG